MTSSKNSTLVSACVAWLCLIAVAFPHAVFGDSAESDFSINSNPNGVWSYGWSYGLGSAFILDMASTDSYGGFGVDAWLGNQTGRADGIPYVLFNDTNTTPTNNHNTVYQPGVLALQSGLSNAYAIVRWTAPAAGTYSIAATFTGLSALGDSADVHVLHNGTSLFDSTVIGHPSPATYSAVQVLGMGDTIDFAVGNDGNGPNEDNTALSATIIPVTRVTIECPPDITVSNDSGVCSAVVDFPVPTVTGTNAGDVVMATPASGSTFPVGTNEVVWTVLEGTNVLGSCSFTITVVNTEPLAITNVVVDKSILWPPNHKMVNVTVDYADIANCDPSPNCSLSVVSSEPVNGPGDGNTSLDWEVLDAHHVLLRAERSGGGLGRTYTITITCADLNGNSASADVNVFVPQSRGRRRSLGR